MKYLKFETVEQAEEYRIKLQAHHDATHTEGLRIVDCIVPTWDGMFALTLLDDDYPATDGEAVESIEIPQIEEPIL
jgi:hypothetical protein